MSSAHLVKDLHKAEVAATRQGFGEGLAEAGRVNDRVVALCADLTDSTKISLFAEEFPERFVEIGIAEQNLVTVASGMAAMGKIPFASSYAAFNPGRNWEQIKTTIALNNQPVNIVGAHAGLHTGPDGATHQMLEDIAIMRAMPNMMVICPGDAVEAKKATIAMAEDKRPAYIRLVREKTPVFTTKQSPFSLDKAYVLRPGKDLSIISTGVMTHSALVAAEQLAKAHHDVEVVHVPVVKPIDAVTITNSVNKTGAAVTIEMGQISGGLGGAVAELLAEHQPAPMRRLGVKDQYGESGDPDQLLKAHHLDVDSIVAQVHEFLNEIRGG